MRIYCAVYLVRGLNPGFFERLLLGIPVVPDRYESLLIKRASPILSEQDLTTVKTEGWSLFGQKQTVKKVEYLPTVELVQLTKLEQD